MPDTLTTNQAAFHLTRTFDAPRDLVWKAWTDPEALAQWWGPKGASIRVAAFDLRPGGSFLYAMAQGDQPDVWAKFTYREITPPERLSFVSASSDEHGNTAANPWLPVFPLEILNVLTFTEDAGKTQLDLRGNPINATEAERQAYLDLHASIVGGFKGTFEKLDAFLAAIRS